jgi:CubicO group peptidase (beta-lactamase class C family)
MTADRRLFLKAAAASALVAPASVFAQSPGSAQPPRPDKTGRKLRSGGLSRARLVRMHEAMARHVESGRMPGLVTLVSCRGETHVDAFGVKAFGGKDPMRRDTIFRIASIIKPITAAAAMILVEEAKLRLDDPVDPLLPELANRKVLKRIDSPLDDTVPARRAITLRDLLTFRLGIGAVMVYPEKYPIQKAMADAGVAPSANLASYAPDELMKRFCSLPLVHQPGENWMYHSGSDILGVLIARATGKTLETFLRERIFAPLGMKDTAFSVPEAKLDRLATCYQTDFATGKTVLFDEARGGRFARPPRFRVGRRGPRLDGRRLSGLRPDDAEQGNAWARAHPLAGLGRADDGRPHHPRAEGGVRLLPQLLGQPRLGLRYGDHHPARRSGAVARNLRLGRRLRHVLVRRPQGGHDRHPHDAACLGFTGCSRGQSRFLDLGIPGYRRLTTGPRARPGSDWFRGFRRRKAKYV